MGALSDRQQRMLEFIRQYVTEHGRPPTVREIGLAVGISSTSVVDYNLRALERDGHLRRARDLSRGIELPDRGSPSVRVLGLIAAGQPIEAVSDGTDVVEVPQRFVDQGCYALRVKGKSMIDDHIDDGDVVIVKPQDTVDDGEIAVALVVDGDSLDGEATLKRVYREGQRVRLQPANPAMDPIYVDADRLRIQGRVVSVIRSID
ncbi:MAG TPA: transcriptional repressor LexA [Chloroflexota bacterium]|nr:transcriptional repressor LexA [Chloroflexota bacterium]